jgi:plastocyanin
MRFAWRWQMTSVLAAVLGTTACGGSSGGSGPSGAISASVSSGDEQIGTVGTALAAPIVVSVAQGGSSLAGQGVSWSATGGSTLSPSSGTTGSNGLASTTVTLGSASEVVTINASVSGAGSPVAFRAYSVPANASVVEVRNNTFVPASVTIARGGTVAWVWKTTSTSHNVVPDVTSPTTSGAVDNGPKIFTFTFPTAGTYRYFCSVHGGAGGAGMAGTIVVN